eukprot:Ihof_evm2s323 gene=Ihof_evmTU2s323
MEVFSPSRECTQPTKGDPIVNASKVLHSETGQLELVFQNALRSIKEDEKLFSPDLHNVRRRITENYEKLLFMAYEYSVAKDVELALWHYGFYLVIEDCRNRLRKRPANNDGQPPVAKLFLKTFLLEAMGFYHGLLRQLLYYFSSVVPSPVYLDLAKLSSDLLPENPAQRRHHYRAPSTRGNGSLQQQHRLEALVRQSLHRCLIFLGDLARYQSLLYMDGSEGLARQAAMRHYMQAFYLYPEDGRAFNQLGVLHSSHPATLLDAIYCYFRSLAAMHTLSNASNNIKGCFDRHRSLLESCDLPNDPESCPLNQLAHTFCTKFTDLHRLLFLKTDLPMVEKKIEDVVGVWSSLLGRVLTTGSVTPCNFDYHIIQKVFLINIAAFYHLTQTHSGTETHGVTLKAQQLTIKLTLLMYKHAAMVLLQSLAQHGTELETNDRGADMWEGLTPSVLLVSEWILCQYDAAMAPDAPAVATLLPSMVIELDRDCVSIEGSTHQPLWAVIALLGNKLATSLEEGTVGTANHMTIAWLTGLQKLNDSTANTSHRRLPALANDLVLRGFVPLTPLHRLLSFPSNTECCSLATHGEEKTYQCSRLIAFMRVASTLPRVLSQLAYDDSTCLYYRHDTGMEEDITQAPQLIEAWRCDEEKQRRKGVMRAMAQQRLQAEVQTLENEMVRHRHQIPYALTLYVIPDLYCFIDHLKQIKDIVNMQRYVVVVPRVAIRGLDDLKKGSDRVNKASREVTRWLEDKFRQGDHWIRAQKPMETVTDGPIIDPPLYEDDASLLDCCLYFANSAAAGK